MPPTTALIIGASGFVGGHLCSLLSSSYPALQLLCLLRNATPPRIQDLKNLNPNIKIVEGDLEDITTISSAAEEVDIVIHIAHSDHVASVQAVLAGLRRRARGEGGRAPVYLHMSGLGVIADNVRGEKAEGVKEWSDVGFALEEYATCVPSIEVMIIADVRAVVLVRIRIWLVIGREVVLSPPPLDLRPVADGA